ncbi:DNA polymerase III subunit delta [Ornithinibacillus massiliensis]|uniref:DNA polymerase III subunit delta n=1 Tax=Ornithinibacillus massiliensis TaxID=1944633 RepID=A0ABS5MB37_9BACI|nr:DNA polymerase III subunit delta [Ornithinibacillus massiliensis]MBS3679523.1 DNA polymerase III subunit delta [Ornithinibacillus massiliensis]
MTYTDVVKQIKKKQIPEVILLYGTENYFIQKIKDLLVKGVLDDEENLSTYDLTETSIQEVIADVETYPFFGEKKLVIATNALFLKAKSDKLPFEHDLSVLEQYLEMPVDYSVLVLIAPYEKIDERKKISKLLKNKGLVAECNPVKEYELKNWIVNLAKQLHVTIDEDAFEIFENELSTDLNIIESELEKIALYVGAGGTVTKQVAEELVSHTITSSGIRLVDTVIEGNLAKAITIYKDLEIMKEEPIALIGLLAFQFRTILRVKLLKQKGYSSGQMQKQLGVHPYVIKVALNREGKFTVQKLEYIIDQLTETDAIIKQGKMEKSLAFEMLLYNLIKK